MWWACVISGVPSPLCLTFEMLVFCSWLDANGVEEERMQACGTCCFSLPQ